ncbi:AP-1-like transcription factor [Parahypoxylon ruwenzoriense]
MDFSQTFYGGAHPYHFIGIPPLTPSHSNSAASDEFNNHSPHDVYDGFQGNDHFQQNFEPYAQFNHQTQTFPGPPGPPTPPAHPMHNQNGQNQSQVNGASGVKNSPADILPMAKPDPDANRQTASNSDDDELTPAQSRRKAQNRAAQRAFRERKERHVKDLEAKLASLEAAQHQTASENEKLKRDLQKMSTENEILRATSNAQAHNGSLSPAPTTTGPMQYNPTDFYSDLLQNHANKTPSHRIVESGGERLLAAGATWDYIINHELFKKGLVDVGDVSLRLKSQAKCDGQGPVFEERVILQAIVESVASGSDELL